MRLSSGETRRDKSDVMWDDLREFHARLVQEVSALFVSAKAIDVIRHVNESHTGSLRPPSC